VYLVAFTIKRLNMIQTLKQGNLPALTKRFFRFTMEGYGELLKDKECHFLGQLFQTNLILQINTWTFWKWQQVI